MVDTLKNPHIWRISNSGASVSTIQPRLIISPDRIASQYTRPCANDRVWLFCLMQIPLSL